MHVPGFPKYKARAQGDADENPCGSRCDLIPGLPGYETYTLQLRQIVPVENLFNPLPDDKF